MPVPTLNIPSPDPSELTTHAIFREVENLRKVFDTRIDALDKAAEVFAENLNRVPTVLDREIGKVSALTSEKFASQQVQFAGVQLQFQERDVRSKASETAAQTGLTTALAAQKEQAAAYNDANAAAVTKSEAATVKQIDSILALLASNTKAIDEKIASIQARLDRNEGANNKASSSMTSVLSIAAVLISLLGAGILGISTLRPAAQSPQASPQIVVQPPAAITTGR